MTNFLATVIVPIKNMSGRMQNISSWLAQIDEKSFEIIFINDNSSDATLNELHKLKNHNPFLKITVLSGSFSGPGGARNRGLESAQGRWILFWDSDDVPDPKSFLEMLKHANSKDFDFAVGKWAEIREGDLIGSNPAKLMHGNNYGDLIQYPGIWRWAFRREAIGETRFPPLLLGEDLIFLSKLPIQISKVYRYPEIVYEYLTGQESQLTNEDSVSINSKALNTLVRSKQFLTEKTSIFGFIIKLKLLISHISRMRA